MTSVTVVHGTPEGPAAWPAPAGSGALVLTFASTPAERAVIDDWLRRARSDGTRVDVVEAADARLEQELATASDDPWVVPVRVAWLPRERNGVRAARPSDLLFLADPRRPRARLQARILRQEPDRCRVVVGEPARLSDLRVRFNSVRSEESFPIFVERQARLALERAERSVIGMQYKVPRLVAEEI
ncbi:MAG: glycerol-3-phosphate O-acyltransferase, partial [Solirubrobacteraceae bacterium]|nr:glycerol-3-phosphate O-acyltransferase [Solirubrobacteraceae bacterium]